MAKGNTQTTEGTTAGTTEATTGGTTLGGTTNSGTTTGVTGGTQTQAGTVNPWEAAQPMLKNLLAEYAKMNPGVTGGQTTALNNLNAAAAGLPGFGAQGTEAVNKLFNSSTGAQVGMLSSAYDQLKGNLGGMASGAELDPYKTPGFADALATMTGDITSKVKGVYAGSGRDGAGAGSFGKSLGRGLTEGLAPTIANQFNTNNANRINAAGQLFGAGGSTAKGITEQNQIPLMNAMQGMGQAGMLQELMMNPAKAQLGAANAAQALPFENMKQMLEAATKFGGMGGSTTGTGSTSGASAGTSQSAQTQLMQQLSRMFGSSTGQSSSTTTQQQSMLSNLLGGASGIMGILSFLSDERAKEEIEPVGELDDGQTVFRYRYKGDPRMQIGLLAQEVEDYEPDAVSELPNIGLLAVDYRKATNRAAEINRRAA